MKTFDEIIKERRSVRHYASDKPVSKAVIETKKMVGAEAFKKDLPNAEIYFVDSCHFALESHVNEIAELMIPFLKKHAY